MQKYIGQVVLVRDNRAGIHVGTLDQVDLINRNCVLSNARKVWYWEGAASCHGIASQGLCHQNSRVAPTVPVVGSCDVVEIILCTPKGAASVLEAPVWGPPKNADVNGYGGGYGNGFGFREAEGYGNGTASDDDDDNDPE